jgi:MFS family permease
MAHPFPSIRSGTQPPPSAAGHDGNGGAAAWFAVVILCIAQIVSTIDRGMLALVIDPVRADLLISEIQIALLQGFAFSVFYVTIGLPLGAVADVVNRRRLLIGGIIVWSAATIGGGLAQDFGHMFASRVFIGVGEAVLGPCAVTMIGDMFPPSRRGRPIAVYVLGSMVAYGVGSLVSGYILQIAPTGAFSGVPFLADLAPWRIVFVLVGSFGFVIACLLALLREPPRRGSVPGVKGKTAFRASLRHFIDQRGAFLPLYGMLGLFAMGGSAATGWGAVLLTRSFGFQIGAAGKGLGVGQITWAVVGALVASVLVDRVSRDAGAAGKVKLAAALCLAAIPATIAGLVGNGTFAVVLLSEIMFASAVFGTTMLSVISQITPPGARGLAVALYAFVMTMIGGSLGPLAVAYLTQHVFGAPEAVGQSMAIVGVASLGAATLLGMLTVRRMRVDHDAAAWLATEPQPSAA